MRTLACAAAAAALLLGAPVALAHQGNPHYRSVVTSVTPADAGRDRLGPQLRRPPAAAQHERQGRHDPRLPDRKPYARLLADGTVQVNTNSEAYYLNEDRLRRDDGARRTSAPSRSGSCLAQRRASSGTTTARTGWARATRRSLKDKSVKTKIDDWTVPIKVGGQQGAIAGTLTWVPLRRAAAAARRDLRASPRC